MMLLLNIKNFHLSIKNPRFYKEKVKKRAKDWAEANKDKISEMKKKQREKAKIISKPNV